MSYSFFSSQRQETPPNVSDYLLPSSAGTTSSNSSIDLNQSYTCSPASVQTHITTPPRSPYKQQTGPTLIPKVRVQDQLIDPFAPVVAQPQVRAVLNTPYSAFNISYSGYRRSTSPQEFTIETPTSINDYGQQFACYPSATSSYASYPPVHSRSVSAASAPHHVRSVSTSHFDGTAASKRIATQYCKSQYLPPRQGSAPPATETSQSSKNNELGLAPELLFESYDEPPETTTLIDYLTGPNPSPNLVRKLPLRNHLHDLHYWWDVRNIRLWRDFNLQTIRKIPGFDQLLELPFPAPVLPQPGAPNLSPETVTALHDTHRDHYTTKVNAALKVSLGEPYLKITQNKLAPNEPRPKAEFVANYESDMERTIYGSSRSRVIGIVRSFNEWNTSMRTDSSTQAKISYYRELAHLHCFMREHGCRYGFIMTEIELVCVRAGVDAQDKPIFGLLELAHPISLSTHGKEELTACLALWYLHMLAKELPLEGQYSWRLKVDAPAALTRRNCLEREKGMLKPEGREKRQAKSNRGWIWPEDPFNHRKELPKAVGRRRAHKSAASVS